MKGNQYEPVGWELPPRERSVFDFPFILVALSLCVVALAVIVQW